MQLAFNLVLLRLPLTSRAPSAPVSYVSCLPARLSSSANVLICCLVQPDGFGRVGREEGKEVTYRDLLSLKVPLKSHSLPLPGPSVSLSQFPMIIMGH